MATTILQLVSESAPKLALMDTMVIQSQTFVCPYAHFDIMAVKSMEDLVCKHVLIYIIQLT